MDDLRKHYIHNSSKALRIHVVCHVARRCFDKQNEFACLRVVCVYTSGTARMCACLNVCGIVRVRMYDVCIRCKYVFTEYVFVSEGLTV